MKKLLCMTIISMMLFTACSFSKDNSKSSSDKPNNFYNTFMETDNGYYLCERGMSLKFFDKATKTEVFLCNKPECQHDNSSFCNATAENITVNDWVLYDGYIYLLCIEKQSESVEVNIYRASLDGSSLTKFYEVTALKKSAEQDYQLMLGDMIIHKNRIYLTYKLATDTGAFGFGKAQFCEINLDNKKIKVLYEIEDNFSQLPSYFCGIGDKLYYSVYDRSFLVYEYDIKTNKTVEMGIGFSTLRSDGQALYGISEFDGRQDTICRYDIKTKEITPIVSEHNNWFNECFTVDSGLLFLYDRNENSDIVTDVYDLNGTKICTIDIKDMEKYSYTPILSTYNGYVYIQTHVAKSFDDMPDTIEYMYDVLYRCSIEDIKNKNINFELVYKRNEYYAEV